MWPLQRDCDGFFGDPRGPDGRANPPWEAANLTHVAPPFKMTYAGQPVAAVKIHRKCADSLARVFQAIWTAAGKSQAQIDRWGVSKFGGSYNFRLMRGSNHLSMHSYGCALDLAPERFPMGSHAHTFVPQVLKAFADEGWENLPNDRMHFQAARVSGLPAPAPWTGKLGRLSVTLATASPASVKTLPAPPQHRKILFINPLPVGHRFKGDQNIMNGSKTYTLAGILGGGILTAILNGALPLLPGLGAMLVPLILAALRHGLSSGIAQVIETLVGALDSNQNAVVAGVAVTVEKAIKEALAEQAAALAAAAAHPTVVVAAPKAA